MIRWTTKYSVFVVIEDDMGRVGLGECWCFDTKPDALLAFLRTEVLPHFEGASLSQLEDIAEGLIDRATLTARHGILASALSGVDLAVWDLRAQTEELPLCALLNSEEACALNLYASGGLYGQDKTDQDLAAEIVDMCDAGFDLCKMKIGAMPMDQDVARVKAALDAMPTHARLIIDGVYSYTAKEAATLYDALPTDRIDAFQSPVKAWDLNGMTELSKIGVPVMAVEAEYRPEIHRILVEDAQVAFLQTAPIANGGVAGTRKLAQLCEGTNTQLSLEVSSTGVALMAACHIAASQPRVAHVEYHTVHQVFFPEFGLDPIRFDPTQFTLPGTPGLGISLPCAETLTANAKDASSAFKEPHKRSPLTSPTDGDTDEKPYH